LCTPHQQFHYSLQLHLHVEANKFQLHRSFKVHQKLSNSTRLEIHQTFSLPGNSLHFPETCSYPRHPEYFREVCRHKTSALLAYLILFVWNHTKDCRRKRLDMTLSISGILASCRNVFRNRCVQTVSEL